MHPIFLVIEKKSRSFGRWKKIIPCPHLNVFTVCRSALPYQFQRSIFYLWAITKQPKYCIVLFENFTMLLTVSLVGKYIPYSDVQTYNKFSYKGNEFDG